ncbi:flagellar motor protein MotB [Rosenbergiella sp. S61]|uniref:Flagellar motor protein MotB n=1 Tax=Rosenbergiella gaditana TaxID=2726987 RepID=A0ABS5SSA8_9GAMM|nr:flagellar motor protein MotB [Rosenbergiella gaditana]MBT0722920.1 flagellar motor protein MotB [Rosenbergiella gaditana]
MKDSRPPIIVIKKKKKHARHDSHGAWKIAYADFMTAMMAFFMVMWLISIADPQKLESLADYFRMPLRVALSPGKYQSDTTNIIPGGKAGRKTESIESLPNPSMSHKNKDRDRKALQGIKNKIEQLLITDPRLKSLRPHLFLTMINQGLRIQIVDSQQRPMFLKGSAVIEPYMAEILHALTPILNDVPNKMSIAGHTDNSPYVTGEHGFSNWELSTQRANSSRRELVKAGLVEGKVLRITGMSDTMNMKDVPSDAPENRRISLLILTHDAEDEIEKENHEDQALVITDAGELQRAVAPQSTDQDEKDKKPTERKE